MADLITRERQSSVARNSETVVVRQYLTFLLGGEQYALDILNIKEIIEYGQITAVPMMPAFIRGVINLRGSVVPVIDLRTRFGRSPSDISRRTCIVILEVELDGDLNDIGVTVDSVNEVVEISPADIEPAPSFGSGIRADFVAGMGKIDGHFVIILEIAKVLSLNDMAMLAELGGAEEAGA